MCYNIYMSSSLRVTYTRVGPTRPSFFSDIEPRPYVLPPSLEEALHPFDVDITSAGMKSVDEAKVLGLFAAQAYLLEAKPAPADVLVVDTNIFSGRFFDSLASTGSIMPSHVDVHNDGPTIPLIAIHPRPSSTPQRRYQLPSDLPDRTMETYFEGPVLEQTAIDDDPSILTRAIYRALETM